MGAYSEAELIDNLPNGGWWVAPLCGVCGESVVPGEDMISQDEQGLDCHEACLDPDGWARR